MKIPYTLKFIVKNLAKRFLMWSTSALLENFLFFHPSLYKHIKEMKNEEKSLFDCSHSIHTLFTSF